MKHKSALFLAGYVLLLQLRPDVATAQETSVDLRPFFTIPKLHKPPVINGRIRDREWSRAEAVAGFTELNTKKLATRQTRVYAGYDNERLYFAFRCLHEGKVGRGEPTMGDRGDNPNQVDDIEIRLVPPDGKVRRFAGWPAGGMLFKSQAHQDPWNANWEFKSNVQSAGETIGGIMSFYRKIWTSEISVSFKDLGVPPPADGETWRINFTRSFSVSPGKRKIFSDWTSWSPIGGGFAKTEHYGTVTFRADAPALQCHQVGDLTQGDLAIKGFCRGGCGPIRIESKVAIANAPDKTLSVASTDIAGQPGKQIAFAIMDSLKVSGSTEAILEIAAKETDSGRLLAHSVIPLTIAPPLRVKLIPILSKGILYANCDATRLGDPPETVSLEAAVYKGGTRTEIATSTTWKRDHLKGDLKLDIAGLAPGKYQLKALLKDKPNGKTLVSSAEAFTIPPTPDWLGNKIGISDKIPPPWHPVEVAGNQVHVTQREYTLSPIGLPQQVKTLGEDLFASAPQLTVVLNGNKTPWKLNVLQLSKQTEGQVAWSLQGSTGHLSLTGTLTIEFDGFALLNFTISSDKPLTIDALVLEFPFKKKRSLYAGGEDGTGSLGYCPTLLDYDGEPKVTEICTRPFSLGEWAWPNNWFSEVWLGDDERGFSVMCQTQENLKGTRRTVIDRNDNANTLKLYLIDGPYELTEPLKYEYMWQATPVKPRPANPKIWHTCYRPRDVQGSRHHLYITTDYWSLKRDAYPAHRYSQAFFDKKNKLFHESGVKLVPYTGTSIASMEVPELHPFLPGWESYPHWGGQQALGKWQHSCLMTSWADYYLYFLSKAVDDLGFDGLYHDVSQAGTCRNYYHGCGYQLKGSDEWHPVVNILASRRVYKRMYTFLKSDGRDGVLFRHVMPVAAVAGFVDAVTQGEEWAYEREEQYNNLTPEIFRAREMRTQFGTPYTWYTFHHYHRGIKYGGRVPLNAILTYCLPHRVLPTEGRAGMWPVWKVTDEFWTSSEFIGYWSPDSPIKTNQENVLGSVYLKKTEKKAMLVVANWNTEPRSVKVKIDLAKLGMDAARVRVTRAVQHPILQPEDKPDGDTMDNGPIEYRDGHLKLDLHGRNLEILILKAD